MQCSSKTITWRLLRILFLRLGPMSVGPGQTGRYAAVTPRRFPPPWSIDELEASFVVIDSAGQKLALPRLGGGPARGGGPDWGGGWNTWDGCPRGWTVCRVEDAHPTDGDGE